MKRLVVINLILILLLYIIPVEEVNSSEQLRTVATSCDQVSEQVSEQVTVQVTSRNSDSKRVVADNEMTVTSDNLQSKATKISQEGIDFIKQFEGCKLEAYRLEGENLYTIGFGHTGNDVKKGQVISQEFAETLLVADLQGYTDLVLKHCDYLNLNQNELDALVSFTYNCGFGNLKKLTANGTRTKEEIAEHITAYTKSESEVNRNGLKKRREAEKEMFQGI